MSLNPNNNINHISLPQLINNIPLGILCFDNQWNISFVNENFFRFGVISYQELIGKHLLKTGIPDALLIRGALTEHPEDLFIEKEIGSIKTQDGGEISLIVKGLPIFDESGAAGGMFIVEDLKVLNRVQTAAISGWQFAGGLLQKFCDSLLVTDGDFNIKYNSGIPGSLCVNPSENAINHKIREVLIEEASEFIVNLFNESLPNNADDTHYSSARLSVELNGEEKNYSVTLISTHEAGERLELRFILLKDVSSRIAEEKMLSEEMEDLRQYKTITSGITDAIIATDMIGHITFWNTSAMELFGYSRSEVFSKEIDKVIKGLSDGYFDAIKNELLFSQARMWEGEIRVNNPRSNEEFISVKITPVENDGNNHLLFFCSGISERMKLEKELRQSEERYRNIVIHADEYICNMDMEGNITYVNPSFVNTFGYTGGELLSMNLLELSKDQDIDNEEGIKKLLTDTPVQSEMSLFSKDGRRYYILANISPVLGLNGRPKYFVGIFTDITAKKNAEKDLLMIRSVYEASRDGIAVEVDRHFILVNDSFAQIFGYEKSSELIGKDSLDIVSNKDIPIVARYIQLRENREPAPNQYEFLGKRKDGTGMHVETSVTSYEADGKTYIVSVCRDITERKRAQEAIKDSEEKYRSITENIDDFLWTAERLGSRIRPVFYTATVEKVTGYSQEQFITDSKLWFKLIYPNDVDFVTRKLKILLKDPARVSEEIDFRIINRIGNVVWVRNKIKVQRNPEGEVDKIYGLVSDISLSKRAEEELKKSTEGLKELNDTKDKFISIISHDLRTPFSSILGFTDILLSERDIPEKQKNQYISFIQESSRNMLSLVNSLLDWTRLQTGRMKFEPQRMNIRELIDRTVTIMTGTALQKNIHLESGVQSSLFVHADSNLMLQVFNNLVSNAVKFTNTGGTIRISAKPSSQFNQIEFTVQDSGVGIKPDDLDKLFKVDSKFTLEGTAGERGSGLGLSIVHEIILKHGGTIWVESEYGNGTEFHFTLPVAAANILLVDDSKNDRLLYSKILKNVIPKYRVDEANNGREAFEMVLKNAPALIISDHNMPEMSGYDLVKQIRVSDIKGKPPVIILSADLNKPIIDEYRELGVEYIFQKPVNLSSFKDAIEKSLRKALFA